jgi:hypothetical protein
MLIMTLRSKEKKTVLLKSIKGNLTFVDVNTYTYKENELVRKEIIINYF